MVFQSRAKYSPEEEIMIVELYSRLDYREINDRNPEIIALAKFFSDHGSPRTVSAIRNKMENLKSVDDDYREGDQRVGRKNISNGLRLLWAHFVADGFSDIDAMKESAKDRLMNGDSSSVPLDHYLNGDAGREGRDKATVVLAREGQEIFRQRTLRNYSYRCCVTGLAVSGLLEACHIVPWKLKGEENIRDRMDLGNGLCLNPLMHTAFDKGFMGIDEDMRVMYSPDIRDHYGSEAVDRFFRPYDKKVIFSGEVPAKECFFEYYHRNVFGKG